MKRGDPDEPARRGGHAGERAREFRESRGLTGDDELDLPDKEQGDEDASAQRADPASDEDDTQEKEES